MIISASKVQGYNYSATPDMSTIGKLITWYDYRNGLNQADFSGTQRAISLADGSSNQYQLNSPSVSNNVRRPIVYADAIGNIGNITSFTAAPSAAINKLHNGSAFLIMTVISLNDTIGTVLSFPLSSAIGKPGINFGITPSTRRLRCLWQNDAGTNIGGFNNSADDNIIPLEEFVLIQLMYYGSGTGTNNLKYYVKSTAKSITFNPTFGSGQASSIACFNSIGNVEFKAKMQAIYDLSGKSIAECDAFRTLAVNTLKLDSEYSSLITS
ncbi:hypothetical protein JMN32_19880 [Fulvivirga sp. 29W222]|uniref:Uncharacterized protein n=1 Tax=Fulvivirga marina TaxID=2494733 RepID=A0A937G1R1_9BACT|nr:hypothetical protein [Fulvivirga marina]MBL6448581.1 hypothetical protein [Fulvivirga marina]